MRSRRNRPLFVIDIAMPRDVEVDGRRNRAGVSLQHRRSAGDRPRESRAARRARSIAPRRSSPKKSRSSAAWLRSRGAIPTVVALRQRFESIRRAELQRLEFKLSALPPEARARVDEVTRLIVEKLLLTPTEQLKALGDAENAGAYADALTRCSISSPRPALRPQTRTPSEWTSPPADASRPFRPKRAGHAEPRGNRHAGTSTRHARQPAGAVAGATPSPPGLPKRAARRAGSSSSRHRATGCRMRPLSEIGGKRLFVKEIEDALLRDEIDLAVHSSKDMPAAAASTGSTVAAVLPREDPRDAVVLPAARRLTVDTIDALVTALGQTPAHRHQQRPAHRAADTAVSGRALHADPRQSRHAAAQARRAASTTRSFSPPPACADSGSPIAHFAGAAASKACVPAPGPGHRRRRDPRRTTTTTRAVGGARSTTRRRQRRWRPNARSWRLSAAGARRRSARSRPSRTRAISSSRPRSSRSTARASCGPACAAASR